MVRVKWTPDAIEQIVSIRADIAQFNPGAADQLAQRLIDAGESLASFPNRGRLSTGGCRELAVWSPYIIRYDVDRDLVRILRVRHSARLLDD